MLWKTCDNRLEKVTYVHVSIYQSIHPSIYLLTYLSIYPSSYPAIDLSIYLSIYLSSYIQPNKIHFTSFLERKGVRFRVYMWV